MTKLLSLKFDKNKIISGGADGIVKIRDIKTGEVKHSLNYHKSFVCAVCFEEDTLATSSADTTIVISKIDSTKSSPTKVSLKEKDVVWDVC